MTEHSPAVYQLMKLHAELGGKLKDNAKQAIKLRADMKHVEAVLHILDPKFNARQIAPRRRNNPNPLFKRGTIFREALGVLRGAVAPMSAEAIGIALLQSKGVADPSRDERRRMLGAVSISLGNHKGKTVEAIEGRPRRWKLA